MTRAVAVVTGASSGIGREIAKELARTHLVHALGRSAEALTVVAAETGAVPHVVDLLDAAAIESFAARIDRADVLVHVAAIGEQRGVEAASEDDWLRALRTNVIAPSLLTRALLPLLRAAESTVVFIGSGAGTRPVPGSAVYAASKHALRAVADVLRIDEEQHRLRVVTIAPGQTDTPLLRSNTPADRYAPERYLRPESVAAAVRYVVELTPDQHITDIALRPRQEIARL